MTNVTTATRRGILETVWIEQRRQISEGTQGT